MSEKLYHVMWEMDLNGGTPEEAARAALAELRDPGTSAIVFDVQEFEKDEAVRVDLLELDQEKPLVHTEPLEIKTLMPDAVEVHPLVIVGVGNDGVIYEQAGDGDDADGWGVFWHVAGRGAFSVIDYRRKEDAEAAVKILEAGLKVLGVTQ